jgi:hypothetical protein
MIIFPKSKEAFLSRQDLPVMLKPNQLLVSNKTNVIGREKQGALIRRASRIDNFKRLSSNLLPSLLL